MSSTISLEVQQVFVARMCKRGWEFHILEGLWHANKGFCTVMGASWDRVRDLVEKREAADCQGTLGLQLQPEVHRG